MCEFQNSSAKHSQESIQPTSHPGTALPCPAPVSFLFRHQDLIAASDFSWSCGSSSLLPTVFPGVFAQLSAKLPWLWIQAELWPSALLVTEALQAPSAQRCWDSHSQQSAWSQQSCSFCWELLDNWQDTKAIFPEDSSWLSLPHVTVVSGSIRAEPGLQR